MYQLIMKTSGRVKRAIKTGQPNTRKKIYREAKVIPAGMTGYELLKNKLSKEDSHGS